MRSLIEELGGLGGEGGLAIAGAADNHAHARAEHPAGQPGSSEVISLTHCQCHAAAYRICGCTSVRSL